MNLRKVVQILRLIEQEVKMRFAEKPGKWVMVLSKDLTSEHVGREVKLADVKNNRFRGTLETVKDKFIEVRDEVRGKEQVQKGNIRTLLMRA